MLIFHLGEMGVGLLNQYLEQQFSQIVCSNDSNCILLSPTIQPGQLTNRYMWQHFRLLSKFFKKYTQNSEP